MKLVDIYYSHNVKPHIKRKRIMQAAERAIRKSELLNGYFTAFAVDGLRVYAAVETVSGKRMCVIMPIIKVDTLKHEYDASYKLYVAGDVSVTKDGLMACIHDWLYTIALSDDEKEFGDYRSEDDSYRSDLNQWTNAYNEIRKLFDTGCPTPWLDCKF